MHPNSQFRQTPEQKAAAQAALRDFGQLAINGTQGGLGYSAPLVSHIPFVFQNEDLVLAHLVRSNPIFKALQTGAAPAVLSIDIADAYISPDWYQADDQVPTWNYIAVQLRGQLSLMQDSELEKVLELTSERFEADLAPKPAWTMDKMSDKAKTSMMRAIAPIQLRMEDIQSTWKLNQNKSPEDRAGVIEALGHHPIADWMRAL